MLQCCEAMVNNSIMPGARRKPHPSLLSATEDARGLGPGKEHASRDWARLRPKLGNSLGVDQPRRLALNSHSAATRRCEED